MDPHLQVLHISWGLPGPPSGLTFLSPAPPPPLLPLPPPSPAPPPPLLLLLRVDVDEDTISWRQVCLLSKGETDNNKTVNVFVCGLTFLLVNKFSNTELENVC